MTEVVKTAVLRLREPTKKKKEKLYRAMDQAVEVANRTAVRLPSISIDQLKNKRGSDSLVTKWVKEFRGDGVDLPFNYTQLAVEQAFTNYLQNLEEKVKELERERGKKFKNYSKDFKLKVAKNYQKVPEFRNRFLKIRGRDIRIHEPGEEGNQGKYYGLVIYPFPRDKVGIPFFKGAHQDFYLERITSGDISFTGGEIVKYDSFWSLNLHIKREVDINYDPRTFVGVDVGLNVLAWAVAINNDGDFLEEIHFDGKKAGWIRDRYNRKRRSLQQKGKLKVVEDLKNREERWIENKNHEVSSRIVEFASQFEKPIIKLERIDGNRLREQVQNPNIDSWRFGDLRDMIEYKALEEGILTKEVPPQYTSQTCPKCGYTDEDNRPNNDIHFKCVNCGYENHADFVGAYNITEVCR